MVLRPFPPARRGGGPVGAGSRGRRGRRGPAGVCVRGRTLCARRGAGRRGRRSRGLGRRPGPGGRGPEVRVRSAEVKAVTGSGRESARARRARCPASPGLLPPTGRPREVSGPHPRQPKLERPVRESGTAAFTAQGCDLGRARRSQFFLKRSSGLMDAKVTVCRLCFQGDVGSEGGRVEAGGSVLRAVRVEKHNKK